MREAVFSLIGPVEGARVLDLFAGSGALGLEALSRGAASASSSSATATPCTSIQANLEKLGSRARDRPRDATALFARSESAGRYDLVFVDPPYEMGTHAPALAELLPRVLAEDGLVVVETARCGAGAPLALVTTRATARRGSRCSPVITAICPGSYDPVTYGHVDVIRRAAEIFDRVVVGVVRDPRTRETMFTVEERVAFLEEALAPARRTSSVDVFAELVVEFARKHEAKTMVKGLRVISDFEWEFQMNHLNRSSRPTSRRSTSWRARSTASSPRAA